MGCIGATPDSRSISDLGCLNLPLVNGIHEIKGVIIKFPHLFRASRALGNGNILDYFLVPWFLVIQLINAILRSIFCL